MLGADSRFWLANNREVSTEIYQHLASQYPHNG